MPNFKRSIVTGNIQITELHDEGAIGMLGAHTTSGVYCQTITARSWVSPDR